MLVVAKKRFGGIKRAAAITGIAAGLGVAAFVGAGRTAGYLERDGPESIRPAAARVAGVYRATATGVKSEVNGIVNEYGWEVFYRALGAACGAATVASIIGGRKRRISTTKGSRAVVDESSRREVGGKVRGGAVALGAVGGAMAPVPAIGALAISGAYKLWRGMSPEQRAKVWGILKRKGKRPKAPARKATSGTP